MPPQPGSAAATAANATARNRRKQPEVTDIVDTIPEVIEPQNSRDYLEVISRAVFQAGVSWKQIASHWGAYRRAFGAFDPSAVASYGDAEVARVLATPGVLRVERKVRATIANAAALLKVQATFGDFAAYVASFSDYDALARDLKKRFSYLGDMNVWYVLFRTGFPVPRFEGWVATIRGEHPRMREMVERARAAGRSREY